MGGWNKQGEEKNRVPDTAHDCPILRIGVMHEQPVSERENLSKWELFSQSGKQLCTGASLWAVPKLARGLRPLEPRHVNGVSIPAKCPPDIPTEHLLID